MATRAGKRPLSGSDEPEANSAKRIRAGLTETQHRRLSQEQVDLLADVDRSTIVEGFSKEQVQSWVAAALMAAGEEGSIDDPQTDLGQVVAVFGKQRVRGAALLQLTVEELMQVGVPLGPAKILGERIERLQAPALKWKGPAKLLQSTGHDWDFQDNGIKEALRQSLPEHYAKWKNGEKDKEGHPLFIVLGAPGTSKSRTLQEIPKLLGQLSADFEDELNKKISSAYVINLTFENGHSELVTNPCDPAIEFGARLMGQLGANFHTQLTLTEALAELARIQGKELRDMAIILAVDGLQGLPGGKPGDSGWQDSDSAFHRGMRIVADLVNGKVGAFVIGAVSCSTMVPGEATDMLAVTRQRREIITPKPLTSVQRSGNPVFDESLRLLVSDMGGLGAALVALKEAIDLWKQDSQHDEDLSKLFQHAQTKLVEQYPAYCKLPKAVIGAALMGTWIDPECDFKDCGKPAKCCLCTLVTLQYNDEGRARFVVPYVLLALKGFMGYNFDDYREQKDQLKQFVTAMHWRAFEEAVACYWHMKSHVFEEGDISLGELHRGATMNTSTGKQKCFSKPFKLRCSEHKVQNLNEHSDFDYVVVNAAGAAGPDVIQPLSSGRAKKLFCAGQMKNFAVQQLTEKLFNDEHAKANAKDHFFIAITTGNAAKDLKSGCGLPDSTAIVDKSNYREYFGPFAFRMFDTHIDLNTSSSVTLRLIEGVGHKIANTIVKCRPYKAPEDLEKIRDEAGRQLPARVRSRLARLLSSEAAA